jgi:hypothetical protein
MAQNDVIDLDKMLDEYQASLLVNPGIAQTQAALQLDQQKLAEFGYVKPEPTRSMSQFAPVVDYMKNKKAMDDAIKKGILADDPYFVENYLSQAQPQTRAEYTGVDFTGGAQGDTIRQIELLPPDIRVDPNYVTRVLQKNYAEDYNIPRTYDYDVRVEPNTRELIFNDPLNNNQPTVINPPGLNKGDFLSFVEPLAAEITAGIGGGVVGGIATGGSPVGIAGGAIAGETAATFIWRLNNLNYLKEQGYLPEDYDIVGQSMKEAGMTALFGLGAIPVFKLVKLGMRVANVPETLLNEDEFIKSFETLKQAGEDTAVMTAPQVMIRAADEGVEIKSPAENVEAGLRREAETSSEQAQPLREIYAEQERMGRELVPEPFEAQGITRELVEEEGGAGARALRGEEIRGIAQETIETSPKFVQAEKELVELGVESDNLFRGIADGSIDPTTAGAQIRASFSAAEDSANKLVDEAYENAKRLANFKPNQKPYDYSKLLAPTKRFKNILNQQAFADPQQKKIVNGIIESIEQGVKKSDAVFTQDLSNLRSIIRQNVAMGNNVDELVTFRKTLESIRAKTLKDSGNKQAYDEFIRAEGLYRQKMEDFNNDQIKRLLNLQTVSNDLYRQGDKTAYNGFVTFLRNNITPQADGSLKSPKFIDDVLFDPENTTGLLGLKGGIYNSYIDEVVETVGDVMRPKSPRAHETFMAKNENIIKKFFTEDEIQQFANAEQFINTFKQRQLTLTRARDAIAKNTNLSDVARNFKSPEDLFNNTWSPGKITATKEVFDALTNNGSQELIDAYKSYVFKDLMEKTQRKGALNQDIFDGNKLEEYVNLNKDNLEVWFGNKFTKQLTDISKKLKAFDDPRVTAVRQADNFMLNSLNSLARAYVGLFTTPGRVMTAVKSIVSGKKDIKQVELLSNPDEMYDAIMKDRWQRNPVVKGLVRTLGRIYYREDVAEEEPTTEVTPEDTIRFGPDFQRPQGMNTGGAVKLKYGYGE